MAMFGAQVYYIWGTMAKEIDNFDDEEMDEAASARLPKSATTATAAS